ncbi:hypothetical protein GCM10027277_11440 [Pseudoduganella ginsengisoli]|uniref:DUF1192 domain-containing protein n=1 Tax=Pseudoduganella ginsengisoli TaxID=1462440 RepID=UPI001E616B44|nr:DUF1192 domain-containing protein [Pseudoduganella ginsengisoli]
MHKQNQFRHTIRLLPIVALLAGAGFNAHAAGQSADAGIAELRAEIARIQAENARLKEALAAQTGSAAAPTAASPTAVAPAPAPAAQEEEAQALGAVTVRGRKKIETLKEVPLSISVVSGQELDRELAQDLSAITKTGRQCPVQPEQYAGRITVGTGPGQALVHGNARPQCRRGRRWRQLRPVSAGQL